MGADVRGDELHGGVAAIGKTVMASVSVRRSRGWRHSNEHADFTRGVGSRTKTGHPKGGRPYKRGYGEPDEKAQTNFTDPESRIMKTSSEGFQSVLQLRRWRWTE